MSLPYWATPLIIILVIIFLSVVFYLLYRKLSNIPYIRVKSAPNDEPGIELGAHVNDVNRRLHSIGGSPAHRALYSPTPESRQVKNQAHSDILPSNQSSRAGVARLKSPLVERSSGSGPKPRDIGRDQSDHGSVGSLLSGSSALSAGSSTSGTLMRSLSAENLEAVPRVTLTLFYSNVDMYLACTVRNVFLYPSNKSKIDQVYLRFLVLPARRFRARSKYVSVDDLNFEEPLRFGFVSREDLLKSALRIRLYGRRNGVGLHKEKMMGEAVVQLADAAHVTTPLTTYRPLVLDKKYTRLQKSSSELSLAKAPVEIRVFDLS